MKIGLVSVAGIAAALAVGSAQAATVAVVTDPTSIATTSGLTGFQTTGADMSGMSVTATFANGASESLNWSATGATSGGVASSLFSLGVAGDTFTANWNLTNLSSSRLTFLTIDAGVGNTVFDTVGFDERTPGSANGLAFEDRAPGVAGSITATYSLAVALNGVGPEGDLFARLALNLIGLTGGGLSGAYAFGADTDNLRIAGDLNPVPIPGALPLFASAIGLAGWFGWRRKASGSAPEQSPA
jgi:hypothetical protein